MDPALAVMVAVPLPFAVIFPFETVATDELLVLQVTLGSALDGLTVAVRLSAAPILSVVLVLFSETLVTSAYLTVTLQVALFLPSPDFAVIVAVPGATAVTFPPETVATEELLVLQVTLEPTSDGETLAVMVVEFPLIRLREVLLNVTVVALYRAVLYSDCAVSRAVFAEAISDSSLVR